MKFRVIPNLEYMTGAGSIYSNSVLRRESVTVS